MIELPLTRDAEDYGRRMKRRYDQRGVKDAFRKSGLDKRWTGHAVEYELHRWLADVAEIEHVWNGGLDNKPDFVIGEGPHAIKVALKANTGDAPREDFIFAIPENNVNKLGDGALFCIVQLKERKIWIAGYVPAQSFRKRADRHHKGDPGFVPGRPFEYACRTIRADELEPAETFFALLGRVAA